jgi:hypothetical protein
MSGLVPARGDVDLGERWRCFRNGWCSRSDLICDQNGNCGPANPWITQGKKPLHDPTIKIFSCAKLAVQVPAVGVDDVLSASEGLDLEAAGRRTEDERAHLEARELGALRLDHLRRRLRDELLVRELSLGARDRGLRAELDAL